MIKILSCIGLLFISFVVASQPIQYYNNAEGKKGNELKTALHSIISGHVDYSYNNAKYLLNYCDADPDNSSNVILLYTQRSQDADTYGTGGDYINREHIWAKSHGGFGDIRPMDSDVHNLHPADGSVNELRSNRDFDDVAPEGTEVSEAPGTWYRSDAWEPSDAVKGQVARAILYMDVRYEGTDGEMELEAVDGTGTYPKAQHGDLETLLEWNRQYTPTDFERRRNERIFNMQLNRNPFVDHPEYADLIWGDSEISAIQITGNSLIPEIPVEGNTVQLNISVTSANEISSILVYWSPSYDGEDQSAAMTANGDNYQGEMSLSGFSGEQYLYYKVVVTDVSRNQCTKHFSAFIHKNIGNDDLTSLAGVQGTSATSPLVGQTVTVSGRVSKIIDSEYYIQNNGTREAICVYSAPETGAIGDSVVITGTVTEYNNLTEIKNIAYFCNLKNNETVAPLEITISDVNEDLEGKLVSIKDVTFLNAGTTISNSGSYTFSDGTGSLPLYVSYTSKLIGETLPAGTNTITGIISQYGSTYQLIARDIDDLKNGTNSTLPEIDDSKELFSLFPNPVENGNITIQTNSYKGASFIITDILGREIKKETLYSASTKINISNLQKGIYIISMVQKSGKTSSKKLLVK